MSNTKKVYRLFAIAIFAVLGLNLHAQPDKPLRFKDLYISQIPTGTQFQVRKRLLIPINVRRVYLGTVKDEMGKDAKVYIHFEADSAKERFIKAGQKFTVTSVRNLGRGRYYIYYYEADGDGVEGLEEELGPDYPPGSGVITDIDGNSLNVVNQGAGSTEENSSPRGVSRIEEDGEKKTRKERKAEERYEEYVEDRNKADERRIEVLGSGYGIRFHKLKEHFCIKRKRKSIDRFRPNS